MGGGRRGEWGVDASTYPRGLDGVTSGGVERTRDNRRSLGVLGTGCPRRVQAIKSNALGTGGACCSDVARVRLYRISPSDEQMGVKQSPGRNSKAGRKRGAGKINVHIELEGPNQTECRLQR